MNKKDYKGYELIKAIHDGEIKEGTRIEVHDLRVLDRVLTIIEYLERRLNWENGNWSTGDLFDDNIYFRVLEDNTEEIEEIGEFVDLIGMNENEEVLFKMIRCCTHKIDEIIKAINSIRKDKNND